MQKALTKDFMDEMLNIYVSTYRTGGPFTIQEWFAARKLYEESDRFKRMVEDLKKRNFK